MLPDYEHRLLQVAGSIRRFVGLESRYESDEVLGSWLDSHAFRCLLVLLVDGMGTHVMARHLRESTFLRSGVLEDVPTVFPPTTSAATTSLLTGMSPRETGWLGWNQYFSEKDDQIILFKEKSQYVQATYPGFVRTVLPTTPIYEELTSRGIRADSAWPRWAPHNACADLACLLARMDALSREPEMRFVYGYWDALDSLMHKVGPESPDVGALLAEIDRAVEGFAHGLPDDVGLVVLADHGQVPVTTCDIRKNRTLRDCLEKRPALEGRCTAYYVKPERRDDFPSLFGEAYGEDFDLYSHEQTVERGLFGPATAPAHPRFEEFIGDWLSVANGSRQLYYGIGKRMRGNHAGSTEQEMMIPIIVSPR